ncbi:MAG: hypothetical protein J6328_01125 [Bacilli bacterium]|nr:hypothetical protein [Bacilli bacterium]
MKNKLLFYPFVIACSIVSFSAGVSLDAGVEDGVQAVKKEEKQEIVSYKEVFKSYYNMIAQERENPTKTFETFVDDYYSFHAGQDIADYTLDFADENDVSISLPRVIKDGKKNSLVTGGGGGTNGQAEDYILKSIEDEYVTPASHFARPLLYGGFDYSQIEVGDVLYEAAGSIGSVTGHTAFVVSIDHYSDYGDYIQTVEAVQPCVSYGFIDDNRMVMFKATFYRVTDATYYIIISAKNFVIMQLGKPYDLHSPLHTSAYSSNWYCSELVWAAYNFTYLDLRNNTSSGMFLPNDFKASRKVEVVSAPSTYVPSYLQLGLVGKSGSTWTIKVTNYSGSGVYVRYNPKMCFLDDAKEWRNLDSNQPSVYCRNNSSVNISITENWFADSIAVCYIKSYYGFDYRNISYAKNLNSGKKTLTQYTNTKMVF